MSTATTCDGVDDFVQHAAGGLSAVGGVMTLAAAVRRPVTRSSEDTILSLEGATGDIWAMFFTATSGNLGLWNGAQFTTAGLPVIAETGWAVVGWSHASAATPRSHVVPMTGTVKPAHQDALAAMPNSGNVTPTLLRIARNSPGDKWNRADYARVAIWDVVLTDLQWEELRGDAGWLGNSAGAPLAMEEYDTNPAVDATGGGADETSRNGTVLIDDTVPWGPMATSPSYVCHPIQKMRAA